MIIEKEFGNDYFGNLIIQNYPNLQLIIVKNSLQNLNLLKICNCEKLKTIETEDGERWIEDGERWIEYDKWHSNGPFKNVKMVKIESI